MERSGSVPSARTAWTTGDGGMLPEGRHHARALGKKACVRCRSAAVGWDLLATRAGIWWSCWRAGSSLVNRAQGGSPRVAQ